MHDTPRVPTTVTGIRTYLRRLRAADARLEAVEARLSGQPAHVGTLGDVSRNRKRLADQIMDAEKTLQEVHDAGTT